VFNKTFSLCLKKMWRGCGYPSGSRVPPLRVGRFPVVLFWRLLCLLSFLVFSCPSGFFLLSAGLAVRFVPFGFLVVAVCASTVAGVSPQSFRFGVLGLLFATSFGLRLVGFALPLAFSFSLPCLACLRVGGVFFFCLKGGE